MSRAIVPLANLTRRIPEAGRIRTGVQVPTGNRGKTRPKAIETFRFTSSDRTAIEQVAEIYGGTARPWEAAPTPGQWEVITEAAEIRIVLPPDPLGGTPLYEAWSGGGCQRRCDGVTAQVPRQGPDGVEMAEVNCLCAAKGEMACAPHTRLSVLLPDVRFAGTWRYESATSWAVAQEMPGMVELIQSLQAKGLTRALLGIEHRKSTAGGQTRRFTIPVLRVEETMDALVAGAAQVGAIGDGARAGAGQLGSGAGALPAGPEAPPAPEDPPAAPVAEQPRQDPDDEVVDAEVVGDSDTPDPTALLARLEALPQRSRNKAEKMRHHAGLPRLDEDPVSGEDAQQWDALLRGVEAEVATA